MTVTLRYFAWVRERTGVAEEQIALPAGVATAAELIDWLKARGPEFAHAFERPEVIRVAIDMRHVKAPPPSRARARSRSSRR